LSNGQVATCNQIDPKIKLLPVKQAKCSSQKVTLER
jgi:hypothetical protein